MFIPPRNLTLGQLGDIAEAGLMPFRSIDHPLAKRIGWGGGAIMGTADIAGSALLAPRRNKLASSIGAIGAGISATALFLGTRALIPIPGLGTALGVAAGFLVDPTIRKHTTEAIQRFMNLESNVRGLHMGGNYSDSQNAYTMRQRAAQEMSTSILNSRKYLGAEAALMHQ